jgi:branched-chain amino acid transport system ATP-binding protein
MLELQNVVSGYGHTTVCKGISLTVDSGSIVSIVGANGAGKTTLLRTISGLIPCREGSIRFEGSDLAGKPCHEIVRRGVLQVAGMASIFTPMTVWENMMVSLQPFKRQLTSGEINRRLEYTYNLFPRLKERVNQKAGTLSGGERQMLALTKALICQPRLLMLDEPSLGLAPVIVDRLFEVIRLINERDGLTILLIEQNVKLALDIAARGYVMEVGKVVIQGASNELLKDPRVKHAYLGIA